jgi:hypothetical protein
MKPLPQSKNDLDHPFVKDVIFPLLKSKLDKISNCGEMSKKDIAKLLNIDRSKINKFLNCEKVEE